MANLAVGGDLFGQAGLAQAGFAQDRNQVGPATFDRRVDGSAEMLALGAPTDQGCVDRTPHPAWRPQLTHRDADGCLVVTATDLHRSARLELDGVGGGVAGSRPNEYLARLGHRFESRRQVHRVTHGGVVATGADRSDQDLAGVDADAHLDLYADIGRHVDQAALHPKRGAHRTLGVVFVGPGRTEQSHHGVADDLVDGSAESRDVGDQALEAPVDQMFDEFGIGALGQGGEPHQIREQDRDHTPLFGQHEQVTTGRAKPGACGHC